MIRILQHISGVTPQNKYNYILNQHKKGSRAKSVCPIGPLEISENLIYRMMALQHIGGFIVVLQGIDLTY